MWSMKSKTPKGQHDKAPFKSNTLKRQLSTGQPTIVSKEFKVETKVNPPSTPKLQTKLSFQSTALDQKNQTVQQPKTNVKKNAGFSKVDSSKT